MICPPEASLGHYLLDDTRKTGEVWDEVRAMTKVQSERHTANFKSLFQASENTSLFLPDDNGCYAKPPILFLIAGARPFVGKLNVARGAVRESSLFDVATPECAHGIGCGDWALHCINVKYFSEQYLLRVLAQHNLSGEEIAYLSTARIGGDAYLHDTPEDNRKKNPHITPGYVARRFVTLVLRPPFREMLYPIMRDDIRALTDKKGIPKEKRLAAQKIPPQVEYELLRNMGILKPGSVGTGPIGTIKYVDKAHQNTSDMLVVQTGHSSFFPNAEAFAAYVVPRMDIVESLHVPQPYKDLYRETADRTHERLHNLLPEPLPPEQSQKIIRLELSRVKNVLEGGPHVPVRQKAYSFFPLAKQACP